MVPKTTHRDDSGNAVRRRLTALVTERKTAIEAICNLFFPRDEHHRRELMQRIVMELWSIMEGHPEVDDATWRQRLAKIAKNTAIGYTRSREYKESARLESSASLQEVRLTTEDGDDGSELDRMEALLLRLDADDLEVVYLYLQGLGRREMAKRLNVSLRTLQYRLNAIRRRLRELQRETT